MIIENIEYYRFNITIDYYKNLIYVKSLSNNYNDVTINILDSNSSNNDDNLLYSTQSEFHKDLTIWYRVFKDFTDLYGIKVNIIYENEIIKSEYFRFKNNFGNNIKPIALKIVHSYLGVGDIIAVSPLIRKLYKIYNQKITFICDKKVYEFYKNNIYINSIINYDDVDDNFINNYHIFDVFDNSPNHIYYSDLKLLASSNLGITLKESEMEYDYIPDKYIDIPELPKKYICINPYITGIDRSWEKKQWQKLVDLLNNIGIYVVSIGKRNDENGGPYHNLNIRLGVDLAGKECQNNLSQTWYIINKSDMFIGFDTGMYIFAGTTDTNILMLGWYGDPYYHQAVRNGDRNYKFHTVRGDCDVYCLTDPKFDVDIHGNIILRHPVQECMLNKNFICKPTPESTYIKIKDILYS